MARFFLTYVIRHRNVYKLNIKYLSDNGISLFSFDDENEFIEEMNNA